jgi:hypothetical protein
LQALTEKIIGPEINAVCSAEHPILLMIFNIAGPWVRFVLSKDF